ncbi:hypothetical protein AX16_007458 [Volvariella volvacea WC 439]|nr:hypothetical protein AX16_007458 [Volvariella volvacea WC 439]
MSKKSSSSMGESSPKMKQTASIPSADIPDGGLQAWATVFGGWLIYFCGLGYFNAYGWIDFYVREFLTSKTPSEVAWIGSVQIALQFFLGIPVGIAFDAGYFHYLMITGSLLYCFSLFMLSLAQPGQYYQVFLAQAIGMGLGQAMTFLPAVSVLAHHFSRRRGFAIGIMLSGASIGGIVFPIMLNKLIFGKQGFAIGVRASAGVVTGLMIIANLVMRKRPESPSGGKRTDSGSDSTEKTKIPTLLRDIPYMTCIAAGVLVTFGLFYPVFYFQLFSIKHGIDEEIAFYTVSFINAGGFVGRLIPNFLADLFGTYNVSIPITFFCAVIIFVMLGINNIAGVVVVSTIYGAMNGAYISLTPALLSDISNDVSEVGVRMGLWFSFVDETMNVDTTTYPASGMFIALDELTTDT